MPIERRQDYTFKQNRLNGRHGWLRLTPAYSAALVGEILDQNPQITSVIDPFGGTGTTGLVCAERGLACDLSDINPFNVWLSRAKVRHYSQIDVARARQIADHILYDYDALTTKNADLWRPSINHIERCGMTTH